MSTQSPPRIQPEDQAQRQLVIDRVLKRVRLSKAKRVLQTRLRLAGFKASHGWQDVSFDNIEPQLSQKLKMKQVDLLPSTVPRASTRTYPRRGPSPPSYQARHDQPRATLTTPDHQKRLPCRSESESGGASSPRVAPPTSTHCLHAPPSSQPRSHHPTPSNPHTPEQLLRSRWTLPRASSQTYSNSTPEDDDELRDQTTAAELMLFLATGSPSPNHRSIPSAVTPNPCHNPIQIPPRFRT